MIDIIQTDTKKLRKVFLNLPNTLFGRNTPFIMTPFILVRDTLIKAKNPYFSSGEMVLLVAFRNGIPAGRILIGYSNNFIKTLNKREGVFSLFDFEENYEVFKALADRADEIFKGWNISLIRGPLPPDGEDNFRGALTDGFNEPPYFLTSWNPPYYNDFYEKYGFIRYNTLYALRLKQDRGFPERFTRLAEKTRDRFGVTIRPFDFKKVDREIKIIKKIVDDTFTPELVENWGDFLPPDEEGIRFLVKSLKAFAEPGLVLLGFVKGEPAGLVVGIPDFNQLFKGLNGNLSLKLLYRFIFKKKTINKARILIFGVSQKHRNKGVDINLMYELYKKSFELNISEMEGSTIGETNYPMWKAVEHIGGRIYKEYRFYKLKVQS
ncbi:MAG: hypothetical protein GXP33_13180 [Spirochaetes bacterium]|nr:hypothetical protein [Spirochaetota bacterium]